MCKLLFYRLLFVTSGLVSGCAQVSSNVEPASVNPDKYKNYDCTQIGERLELIRLRLSRVERVQDINASADVAAVAGGVLTLWAPILFLNGESNQNHLSLLKGEKLALESASKKQKM